MHRLVPTLGIGCLIVVLAPSWQLAGAETVASFEIPAWAFDRGNAKTFTTSWADADPMVAFGGVDPVVIEYDIEFPVTAVYSLNIRYAAQSARPIAVSLDGQQLGQACRSATGGWNTSGAKWEASIRTKIEAGKHTLRLERAAAFPHVVSLRFDSTVAFPDGWKLLRPAAHTLASASRTTKPASPNIASFRLALMDLIATFGDRYTLGPEYLNRLETLEERAAATDREHTDQELATLANEALLANPLLDFDRLLLVQRGAKSPSLGLPRNWQGNSSLAKTGYDDQIATLSPLDTDGELTTLYQPKKGRFVGDVDLHFDGQSMLFSMPGDNGRWNIFEIDSDGSGLRQITGEQPDVDCYDACYLPSGKIIFSSTASFVGVPCVYGSSHVANLYQMDADGGSIRQLCFDQEHNWCPTVLNGGRVLYSRWEYTDTPHSNTRLLFQMNPDGTEQKAFYGSNSYWPNSFFYARPIPGHPTKVVAVIGGHHDHPRMGELVVFDSALGQQEADGAVQRIPGRGKKVEPIISDGLTKASWPKFLHPYPLSEKYFLVSCKPTPTALWGIYLVDVFDNMTLIKELPGYALLEPVPLRKTTRPPVIAEKIKPGSKEGEIYIADIYAGDGLKGIPRGAVKSLRLFSYHYAYQNMGGLLGVVGMDGPWDIKRVIGTVPVYEDGSAKFSVPANTPISLQPLDAEGKALQLMRSWMTAMPGESVSCAGCHQSEKKAPQTGHTMALLKPTAMIKSWYGPTRGFSYAREVQPVVDKYCIGCHNGQPQKDGSRIPDLRGTEKLTDWKSITPGNGGYVRAAGKFSVGYAELHRFVRRPGIESDYHMLEPMEFHADTTQLVQMLKKGHHNVVLDAEAWDRLITWIDLNCPYHGTWGEEIDKPGRQRQRRRELLKLYGGIDADPEAVLDSAPKSVEPVVPPQTTPAKSQVVVCPDWPFDAAEAKRRQQAAGKDATFEVDLGDGTRMKLALIPAGEFVMGNTRGAVDERPLARVRIDEEFWIGTCEVTNRQFARFDADHDSRVESKNTYQFGIHGYPMNEPEQPVVRVSYSEAMAFCRWLSEQTGKKFSLPTEAQWEYACRAGTDTPMSYGDLATDFSPFANVADARLSEFASDPYTVSQALKNPPRHDDWIPKDARFNDGALLSVAPGRYRPNAWGLYDMHGNVTEWTRSDFQPYPYRPSIGADDSRLEARKAVRGGSWRDRPQRCTSSFRLGYQPYQRVYNVGFRVVCEATPSQSKN